MSGGNLILHPRVAFQNDSQSFFGAMVPHPGGGFGEAEFSGHLAERHPLKASLRFDDFTVTRLKLAQSFFERSMALFVQQAIPSRPQFRLRDLFVTLQQGHGRRAPPEFAKVVPQLVF